MELKQEVGQRLKQARKDKGLTQEQAGKAIGKIFQNYSRYERGEFELNYAQIVTLCKLLDISADYLLGLKEY